MGGDGVLRRGAGLTDPRETAALVRAIRRAYDGQQWGGVVMFTIRDVHEFAHRLVELGVSVDESRTEVPSIVFGRRPGRRAS